MVKYQNPFSSVDNSDQHQIWDMLVRRDIQAYSNNDWPSHRLDFLIERFVGFDAQFSDNPDDWQLSFTQLDNYGEHWQSAAQNAYGKLPVEEMAQAHLNATTLTRIDVKDHVAKAHKKFDGHIHYPNGDSEYLNWQTIYFCIKHSERWWISGFVGFLPNPMGTKKS